MNRLITLSAAAAVVVLSVGLAGCAGQSPGEQAVSALALTSEKHDGIHAQSVTVAGVWPWHSGYMVLIKQVVNPDITNWTAYGYEADGSRWAQAATNIVDSRTYSMTETPHKATCMALVGTDGAAFADCQKLTD
jgi:hypothetical protein